MRYVLGIDGGGSRVACLAANEQGELLGYGRGGPVNTNYVLRRQAQEASCSAIQQALQEAGIRGEQVEAAVVSAPIDPLTLEQVAQHCQLRRLYRAAEGETARWTAQHYLDQYVGVTVDAGTGSLARGWARDGREVGAGGFGATLGDEGSGVWISLRAMAAALQASDGRLAETRLSRLLLEHFGLSRLQELPFRVSGGFITLDKMIEFYGTQERLSVMIDSGQIITPTSQSSAGQGQAAEAPQGGLYFPRLEQLQPLTRDEIAGFCPLVVEAARQGDQVAVQILQEAGRELGRLAVAVIQTLGMEQEAFAIVPFGGVFRAGELILRSFRQTCLAVAPQASIVLPQFEPEVGAVLIALDHIGVAIDPNLRITVEQSSFRFPACRRG